MLYERMTKEHQKLLSQITHLQQEICKLPEGKLLCARNGNYYKWYLSDGIQKTYIPKNNQSLAEQLAAKKYLSYKLQDLFHEKHALENYLKHYKEAPGKAEHLLADHPGYQELLRPYFSLLSEELSVWMKEDFEKNPKYPEQLNVKTVSGNMVRSKSEAMIDMLLYTNHIPFRYECALCLDGITVFPDFTIRHPRTGAFYYWEHHGMMNNEDYSKNAFSKMYLYNSNGIIPSVQLITTFETLEHPLSLEYVMGLIEYYFL